MNVRPFICSSLALFLLSTAGAAPAVAGEFRLDADGVGPIVMSVQVSVRNEKDQLTAFPRKVAELTAFARNDSGQPIRYAQFCVQAARRTQGCDFRLWTVRVWKPGEELTWMIDGKAPRGIENPTVMLMKLKMEAEKTAQR